MKKYIAALLALVMLLSLTACGGKGEDVTGKYLCVGEAYGDNPYSPPFDESWLELKNGGKGTYYSGFEFDTKWELDGEAFVGTVTFMAMEDQMSGTLKDGVIEVTYGDKRIRFVKEGVEASSDTSESSAPSGESESSAPSGSGESIVFDGIAGYYPVSSAVFDGEEWTISDLRVFEMADRVFLQLNADGTGELAFENGKTNLITYDEAAGTIKYADGTTLQFTVEGETISVGYFDEASNSDVTMRYTRDPNVAPVAGGTSGASGTGSASGASTFDFGSVSVAGSMEDAFAGYAASGFISPTTVIELGSKWYGVMYFSNFEGADSKDYGENVVAKFAKTSSGREYFEIYPGMEFDDNNVEVSMYIELSDDHFAADIGDEDAWVFRRYLVEDEEQYFSPTLENGALEMNYHYVHPERNYSCDVRFFLREYGAPWDEANDPLPPNYDEYKAALSD